MIHPVNGHLLIEPIKQEGFMYSGRETYEEIGIVLSISKGINWIGDPSVEPLVSVDDKVYFDSWLAAKYPKGKTEEEGFYWLVKWEDVRATEHVVTEISE